MRMYDIIKKKRDGAELSKEEIDFFIGKYTDGSVPDYQASALCMAIYYKGMTEAETAALTFAMANSGDTIDLSAFGDRSVDKHSTGGVGDKTTLVVAPIVASLGCVIAKMSGRGLGHTGGTVDKLESIDGFRTELSPEEFFNQAGEIGISVIGQSGNLTPADKKLYALRDVTATVDSLPLIASSIMSKKLAAGAHTIVLDVKYGSGAFMKTPEDAGKLAEEMVKIGKNCGRNTAAVITDMSKPLGRNVGNSLEVKEAVDVLKGNGPEDLLNVCITLSAKIVSLSMNVPFDSAKAMALDAVSSGRAFDKMCEWVEYQGGNREWIENTDLFPVSPYKYEIVSDCAGYISSMDSEKIGIASVMLGAGREKKTDIIDMSAGIVIEKKTGDYVNKGDRLAVLFSSDDSLFGNAVDQYLESLGFSSDAPVKNDEIYAIIG